MAPMDWTRQAQALGAGAGATGTLFLSCAPSRRFPSSPSLARPRPSPGKTGTRGRWGRREIADTAVAQATLRISYQQSAPGVRYAAFTRTSCRRVAIQNPQRSLSCCGLSSSSSSCSWQGHRTTPHTAKSQSLPCVPESVPGCTPRPPYRDLVLVVQVRSLLLLLLTTI